jgi:hypothetical protein
MPLKLQSSFCAFASSGLISRVLLSGLISEAMVLCSWLHAARQTMSLIIDQIPDNRWSSLGLPPAQEITNLADTIALFDPVYPQLLEVDSDTRRMGRGIWICSFHAALQEP